MCWLLRQLWKTAMNRAQYMCLFILRNRSQRQAGCPRDESSFSAGQVIPGNTAFQYSIPSELTLKFTFWTCSRTHSTESPPIQFYTSKSFNSACTNWKCHTVVFLLASSPMQSGSSMGLLKTAFWLICVILGAVKVKKCTYNTALGAHCQASKSISAFIHQAKRAPVTKGILHMPIIKPFTFLTSFSYNSTQASNLNKVSFSKIGVVFLLRWFFWLTTGPSNSPFPKTQLCLHDLNTEHAGSQVSPQRSWQ